MIDRYSLDLMEAISGAQMIVIATPTLIAADMLYQLSSVVDDDVIITDVASVKGNLLTAAKQAFGKIPENLVLAHPIAGSEKSGVEAAKADLFVNHRVIITPTAETNTDALLAVKQLWQSTGADVVEMPVEQHDTVLAATSHLPHVLAYALVDALAGGHSDRDNIFRFAAGGFRDFTRIASSDPVMWRDIALANSDAILKSIDLFSENLAQVRKAIVDGNKDELTTRFQRAKSARDQFSAMLVQQGQITEK